MSEITSYVNGGIFLSEKYKELLEQYDIKVLSTFRSRGTFQCETEQGLALLKEYHGSLQKLALDARNRRRKLAKQATPLLTVISQKKKAWSPMTATEPLLF